MKDTMGLGIMVFLVVVMVSIPCSIWALEPLKEIQLGVILVTNDESHCFMFGGLGLSPENTRATGFLTGVGYDAAFSEDYHPAWPKWEGVHISAVYGHAGREAAEKFRSSMENPESVIVCDTLEELFEYCNCLFIVSTDANGDKKDELVPKCLAAKKPLFVDKFLASDKEHAQRFVEMAKRDGVVLVSSSLLWMSEPILQLKRQLGDQKPVRVISAGWSGQNISGDIHPIAHLIAAAGNRKPLRVVYDKESPPRTEVYFEDDVVGELVGPDPEAPFVVRVKTEDEEFTATFRNEDLRAAAIHQLGFFFDAVRGKNLGMPPRVMVDYLAIWDAAQKSKETGTAVSVYEE